MSKRLAGVLTSFLEGVGIVVLLWADWRVALGVFVFGMGQNLRRYWQE